MNHKTEEILSFAEQILGETPHKDLRKFLLAIGNIYSSGKRYLSSFDQANLFGFYGFYQDLVLFTAKEQPETAHAFLSCLKLAFLKIQVKFDSTFQSFFNRVPLLESHEKQRVQWEIDSWKTFLTQESGDHQVQEMTPRIRIRLQGRTGNLEGAFADGEPFRKLNTTKMRELNRGKVKWQDLPSRTIFYSFLDDYGHYFNELEITSNDFITLLNILIREPNAIVQYLFHHDESPVILHSSPLRWKASDYPHDETKIQFGLFDENNKPITNYLLFIPGQTCHLLTQSGIYPLTSWTNFANKQLPLIIPKAALYSSPGVSFYKKMGIALPDDLAKKVVTRKTTVEMKCHIDKPRNGGSESLIMQAHAFRSKKDPAMYWNDDKWHSSVENQDIGVEIVEYDDAALAQCAKWITQLNFKPMIYERGAKHSLRITKNFPEVFLPWMDRKPDGVNVLLDQELSDLVNGVISGNVTLDIEQSSSGIDWFDIHINLALTDTTLTKEEIDLLLKAKGKWIKLQDKGWRKLDYAFSEETIKELADIGLSINDFNGEKQKLHALQLGALAKKKSTLLQQNSVEQINRRIQDIQTRVTPPTPSAISATLRPYQEEGFHFLAYLTTNYFGGILADDMGLGKTLQALTWLAWLHETGKKSLPSLVVAPKSVQENWSAEAARFYPKLRTRTWKPGDIDDKIDPSSFDLLIINYAQLRNRSEHLTAIAWLAVIVDEAQNIKNPTSQSTQCIRALNANERLALTGTPIENRLMDLWSIFSFAMPGVLGNRTSFTKNYDKATDAFARRRLSARTRPFLLRRTKNEVAKDLPDRIEEDLIIDLEGAQKTIYQAELKRARAHLLKAAIPGKLDSLRFHLLSSLLRLRQICCHPALIGLETPENFPASPAAKDKKDSPTKKIDSSQSGKLEALLELLEPLIEQGQKVLVFSQFVSMLEIIQKELENRAWKHYILTGQTNDRGALVNDFQTCEGAAVFLISLKAGGAGLNLTAASYVVLFDPWWNPAVEAQAIDRTHRIGQKSTVIAYRLVVKDTIEEKIRNLQKQKSAVANDILGEENFAKALTLSDFQFLLADS